MMSSNVQSNRNFPKGSYRAYTSLLKQYSGPGSANSTTSSPSPPTPPKPEIKPEPKSWIQSPPPPPSTPPQFNILKQTSIVKPEPKSWIQSPPPPPPLPPQFNILKQNSIVKPEPELNIASLLAIDNDELELLDINVLRAFLAILKEQEKLKIIVADKDEVDANNNCITIKSNLGSVVEDIETNKQTLIQSLKEQLMRFRQDENNA